MPGRQKPLHIGSRVRTIGEYMSRGCHHSTAHGTAVGIEQRSVPRAPLLGPSAESGRLGSERLDIRRQPPLVSVTYVKVRFDRVPGQPDAPCAQNDIHELILGQTVRAA